MPSTYPRFETEVRGNSLGYVTKCIDSAGLGENLLPRPNTLVR